MIKWYCDKCSKEIQEAESYKIEVLKMGKFAMRSKLICPWCFINLKKHLEAENNE